MPYRLRSWRRSRSCRCGSQASLFIISSDSETSFAQPRALRRHAIFYLAALLLLLALFALVNFSVDPRGRLRIIDVEGFNSLKFTAPRDSRTGKAISLQQCDYDVVIVGSSRSESGLDPAYGSFNDRRVFNAALKAGGIYEMNRMVQHILKFQQPGEVIIGLDLVSFRAAVGVADDFNDSPLADSQSVASLLRYALSRQTMYESWLTVDWNWRGLVRPCEYPGYVWRKPRGLPDHAFNVILARYIESPTSYRGFAFDAESMRLLEESLIELSAAGVQVHLFISPVHVVHIEALAQLGLAGTFDDWKRSLVTVVEAANEMNAASANIKLWDFSGYNSITTETVPPAGSDAYMRWFRDSAHYNRDVGQQIMHRMQRSNAEVPKDFGVMLTDGSIDAYLAGQLEAAESYRQTHPQEVARVSRLIRAAQ